MPFYNGFSLRGEEIFFKKYLKNSKYCVSGFSYGAIRALNYALTCTQRVDTIQLFSPIFFQNRSKKFKDIQLVAYKKNSDRYLKNFITSCFMPLHVKNILHAKHTLGQLHELLYYNYDINNLKTIIKKGINIEIYLGEYDKIVDSHEVKEFFLPYATIYLIKNANHFLQTN